MRITREVVQFNGTPVKVRRHITSVHRPVRIIELVNGHVARLPGEVPHRLTDLRREQAILGLVSHPNVLRVSAQVKDRHGREGYAWGRLEDRIFWRVSSRRTLTLGCFLDTAAKIADGLEALHRVEIVHRDIKPDNILFSTDGQPVITDFGYCVAPGLTYPMGNNVQGTPAFMSPQQAIGRSWGFKDDLFSFTTTLLSVITRQSGFQQEETESAETTMKRVAFCQYPWTALAWMCCRAVGCEDLLELLMSQFCLVSGHRSMRTAAQYAQTLRGFRQRYEMNGTILRSFP